MQRVQCAYSQMNFHVLEAVMERTFAGHHFAQINYSVSNVIQFWKLFSFKNTSVRKSL